MSKNWYILCIDRKTGYKAGEENLPELSDAEVTQMFGVKSTPQRVWHDIEAKYADALQKIAKSKIDFDRYEYEIGNTDYC